MSEPQPIPIGPAYAWPDASRWYFTPLRAIAPADAIQVERIVVWTARSC